MVLTSRSSADGGALGARVLPSRAQALPLFQTDETGMCSVFPALKKAEFWSYLDCKLLKCCSILWGFVLCVRPSMHHKLPNEGPTLLSNERLKKFTILFFFFFLAVHMSENSWPMLIKYWPKIFHSLTDSCLALKNSVKLEQGEFSRLLYKFSCALKLIG